MRSARTWVLLLLCSACGDGGGAGDADESSSTATSTATDSEGTQGETGVDPGPGSLPPRPPERFCRFDGLAPELLPPLRVTPHLEHEFDDPVDMVPVPGDDGLVYVAERSGRIHAVSIEEPMAQPVLVHDGLAGLIAIAPAPDFESSGHLYMRVHAASSNSIIVQRFTVGVDGQTIAASVRSVIALAHDEGARLGGALRFGPDAMLYVALGDGASLEASSAAQETADRFGNILRLDVSELDTQGYIAPADNPFYDEGGASAEAWAIGLRDPRHCEFDAPTQSLWCGDVGELTQEVTLAPRGANLGWPVLEGNRCRIGDCGLLDSEPPRASHDEVGGDCEVVGGFVYRGTLAPELEGSYVYADRCTQGVRGIKMNEDGTVRERKLLAEHTAAPVAFGTDADGEVYLLDEEGAINRVDIARRPGQFPTTLSASGCFTDLQTLEAAPDVVPYDINAALWSDASDKDRYIVLPPEETIDVAADGTLGFPVGTAILKMFGFDGATVETRVMLRRELGWEFHTYQWDESGSDAVLLSEAADIELPMAGSEPLAYHLPSRFECGVCHGISDARVLGPRIDQLDRVVLYPNGSADQLQQLEAIGMFSEPLPWDHEPVADPADESESLEDRARAYLHTNCGHCHRPGGWTPPELTLDFRIETPFAETNTCGVKVQYFNPWAEGDYRIEPGAPENSAIWQRISQRGEGQMPPAWTTILDPGAQVVRDFIADLDGCP